MVELFPLWNKERWDTRNRGTDFCLNKHCHITTFQCGSLECFHCDPMEKPKFHWQHLYLVQVKSSKKKKEQLEEGKITFFLLPTFYILYFYFFKILLYFTDYATTTILIFPFVPLHPALPIPWGNPPQLFMSMGHVYNSFSYPISYNALYIPMAIL